MDDVQDTRRWIERQTDVTADERLVYDTLEGCRAIWMNLTPPATLDLARKIIGELTWLAQADGRLVQNAIGRFHPRGEGGTTGALAEISPAGEKENRACPHLRQRGDYYGYPKCLDCGEPVI